MAVQRLGITTRVEYRENYKKDPKLPCKPEKQYKKKWLRDIGWNDWYDFIGKDKQTIGEKQDRRKLRFQTSERKNRGKHKR